MRARVPLCHVTAQPEDEIHERMTGGEADWLEVNITRDGWRGSLPDSRSSAIHQPLCRLRGDHSRGGQAGRPTRERAVEPDLALAGRTWTRTD